MIMLFLDQEQDKVVGAERIILFLDQEQHKVSAVIQV